VDNTPQVQASPYLRRDTEPKKGQSSVAAEWVITGGKGDTEYLYGVSQGENRPNNEFSETSKMSDFTLTPLYKPDYEVKRPIAIPHKKWKNLLYKTTFITFKEHKRLFTI
jgi:hypothetical protein